MVGFTTHLINFEDLVEQRKIRNVVGDQPSLMCLREGKASCIIQNRPKLFFKGG